MDTTKAPTNDAEPAPAPAENVNYADGRSLLRMLNWLTGSILGLRLAMAKRNRHYWGPIIFDGERHYIETISRKGVRSVSWYQVRAELGPAGFFGWNTPDGEVVVRWSAAGIPRKVADRYVKQAFLRFEGARGNLDYFTGCRDDDALADFGELEVVLKRRSPSLTS